MPKIYKNVNCTLPQTAQWGTLNLILNEPPCRRLQASLPENLYFLGGAVADLSSGGGS